jgi:hypothetical protein
MDFTIALQKKQHNKKMHPTATADWFREICASILGPITASKKPDAVAAGD